MRGKLNLNESKQDESQPVMAVNEFTNDTATSKGTRGSKPSRSSGTDAFVVLAMTLTTVALAIGLYLQFRLAFWLAVVAALSVYVGLLALHALVRRSERVEHLSDEVARLKAELIVAQSGRRVMAPMPPVAAPVLVDVVAADRNPSKPDHHGASPTAAVPAWGSLPVGGGRDARGRDGIGRNAQPGPLPPSTPATSAVAASLRDAAMAAVEPRGQPLGVAPPPLPAGQRSVSAGSSGEPQIVNAELGKSGGSADVMGEYWAYRPQPSPLLRDAPMVSRPLEDGTREQATWAPGAGARGAGARGAGARGAGDPGSEESETRDSGFRDTVTWNGRSPEIAPVAAPHFETPPSLSPATTAPAQSSPQHASNQPARGQSGRITPPPLPAAAATPTSGSAQPPPSQSLTLSPREADVEMIQGLIKKLADEVNAAEASLLSKPASSAQFQSNAIEASVNALRTTVDTMRQPDTGATGRTAPSDRVPAAERSGSHVPHEARGTRDTVPIPSPGHAADTGRTSAPRRSGVQEPSLASERATLSKKPVPHVSAVVPPSTIQPPRLGMGHDAGHALSVVRPLAATAPTVARAGQPDGTAAAVEPSSLPRIDGSAAVIDYPQDGVVTVPVPPIMAHSKLAALAEAITAGRLDVLLEPILGLADQRARHYEVSVRLRDKNGLVLDPPESVPELKESGLLPLLDCARINRSAQVARRLADRGKPGSLFSAFSGEALGHDQFLSDFTEAYVAREGLAEQLVLTFAQADVRGFAGRDWETLSEMRELGFRFSVQAVTDLDMDFEALKVAGFDFVKLDATVFLDGMPASGGVIPPADICRHLAQLGMTLIVGQIEDETHLARIFGFGVIYGQGQMFGGARPMKAEALSEASHSAA